MPHSQPGKITIHTLARRSGFSTATVSSVLTNQHVKRGISLKTVERVKETARELGYIPNMAARSLRSVTTQQQQIVIGVITSFEAPLQLTSYAVHALQNLIDHSPSPHVSHTIAIEMIHSGKLHQLPGLLTTDRFHGAIITNTTPVDDDFLRTTHIPFPVVLVNREIDGYDSVFENPAAAEAAADILINLKRRHLAILRPKILTQSTQNRVNAFCRAAMKGTGQAVEMIVCDDLSEQAGCAAILRALDQDIAINGLYCVSDSLALGAYHALDIRKRAIPRQVAVIGVGDSESSPYYAPPLTCVGVSHSLLHETAARQLMSRLNTRNRINQKTSLDPVVILRESTGTVQVQPTSAIH